MDELLSTSIRRILRRLFSRNASRSSSVVFLNNLSMLDKDAVVSGSFPREPDVAISLDSMSMLQPIAATIPAPNTGLPPCDMNARAPAAAPPTAELTGVSEQVSALVNSCAPT